MDHLTHATRNEAVDSVSNGLHALVGDVLTPEAVLVAFRAMRNQLDVAKERGHICAECYVVASHALCDVVEWLTTDDDRPVTALYEAVVPDFVPAEWL
jgi:hypothetical protein